MSADVGQLLETVLNFLVAKFELLYEDNQLVEP